MEITPEFQQDIQSHHNQYLLINQLLLQHQQIFHNTNKTLNTKYKLIFQILNYLHQQFFNIVIYYSDNTSDKKISRNLKKIQDFFNISFPNINIVMWKSAGMQNLRNKQKILNFSDLCTRLMIDKYLTSYIIVGPDEMVNLDGKKQNIKVRTNNKLLDILLFIKQQQNERQHIMFEKYMNSYRKNQYSLHQIKQSIKFDSIINKITQKQIQKKQIFKYTAKYIIRKIITKQNQFNSKIITQKYQLKKIIINYARNNIIIKQLCLQIVNQSKNNPQIQNHAAIAISLVNLIHPYFYNIDFTGINIPNADLTEAHFQKVIFRKANLKYVKFRKCIFKNVDFTQSDLRYAQLGIMPKIQFIQNIFCIDTIKITINKSYVAVGGNDGKIGIYDTQTLKTIKIWNSFSRVWSIKWFNGGKMLVSGHNDTTIKIWSLEINHSISIILGHRGWVRSVDFSNIGNFIATSSQDQTIKLWNPEQKIVIINFQGNGKAIRSIASSPNGKNIAGAEDSQIKIWDLKSQKQFLLLNEHNHYINEIHYSKDGSKLISCSNDKTIKIWDSKTGKNLMTLKGHSNYIKSICYSFDNSLIISVGNDKIINIWNAQSGIILKTIRGYYYNFSCVMSCPESSMLISCSKQLEMIDLKNEIDYEQEESKGIKLKVTNKGLIVPVIKNVKYESILDKNKLIQGLFRHLQKCN